MIDAAALAVVSAVATAIGKLIEAAAAIIGEDVSVTRTRVLAQVAKDAASPADATDVVSGEIDSAMKGP